MKTLQWKRWCFRFLAVLLALSPFVAFELACIAWDWGRIEDAGDPFVGFAGTRPLFQLDEKAGVYRIAKNRQVFFCPDQFLAEKPDNEFRVFCLGGSTVQGRPYAIKTSFARWFQLGLEAADPHRTFDVVNCGGISYASYRLVPVLQEVLTYEPDLIIVYTGHNEFLEDRTYAPIKRRPTWHRWVLRQAMQFRSYRIVWNQWNQAGTGNTPRADSLPKDRSTLATEVEARLDYPGGLQQYDRDPDWRAGVVEHFELNLRRMVQLCRNQDVPIWLVNPVCNLRSSPPFKSVHRDDLTESERKRWQSLRSRATAAFASNPSAAISLMLQARELDGQHAGLAYDLGKALEMQGQMDKARQYFIEAKELDVCPLRIIEPLRERLIEVATTEDVPLIDVEQLFLRTCRDGIPGGFYLVDHVHPSITGHQMIARLLIKQAIDQGIIHPVEGWKETRRQKYAEQLESLDDKYFLEAQRRLEGLKKWAQGRVTTQHE